MTGREGAKEDSYLDPPTFKIWLIFLLLSDEGLKIKLLKFMIENGCKAKVYQPPVDVLWLTEVVNVRRPNHAAAFFPFFF